MQCLQDIVEGSHRHDMYKGEMSAVPDLPCGTVAKSCKNENRFLVKNKRR